MSSAYGSASKSNVLYEENEALYDPYVNFASDNYCQDIPWREWVDAELNSESWDEGKAPPKAVTAAASRNTSFVSIATNPIFDDPDTPQLPPSISYHVKEWKRPQEIFPNVALFVYEPSNLGFELHMPSAVASQCDFFRILNEQLTILQFYAMRYGFPVEMETPNFTANTQGEIWRPWHHIYAMCKAGKGQSHKPVYCPYGKYVLRLFYMGMWRRILVDDKIPCDRNGNSMLPTTQIAGELWPMILTKGLLKILSLTPAFDFSVTDFPLVTVFTGWARGHFNAENKTSEQVWRRLALLTSRYEQSENDEPENYSVALSNKTFQGKKDTSVKESRKDPEKVQPLMEKFCVLFAELKGKESFRDTCTIAITLIRDCPLVKANRKEGTKAWKRIRWIYWAKEKGLWIDENQLPPYRRLQIITFFPELSDFLSPDSKLEVALYDVPIEKEGMDKADSLMEDEISGEENKLFESELWCDFLKFFDYLLGVDVLLKPSYFTFSFKVTCLKVGKVMENILPGKTSGKTAGKLPPPPQNFLIYPLVLKPTFNEPVFLLCESLTGIFLCISLWVCPQTKKNAFGYLEAEQPSVLKVGNGSLVVEQFDWRSIEQGEIIGLTKTVGNSVLALNLKPGRHILKLWLRSNSAYVTDIYSNVNVIVNKSLTIRYLMKGESQMILSYINNVSNGFIALTQKFGKPDLRDALREFYNIIKPGNDGAVGYLSKLDDFIENFIHCILLALKDLISAAEEVLVMMWALRSLFIDPNIQVDLPAGLSPILFGKTEVKKSTKTVPLVKEPAPILDLASYSGPEYNEKAILIQKIFRRYRVDLLWKSQNPAGKEFKPFTERLKKICDTIFIPQKREVEVGKILRMIVMTKPHLLPIFRCHRDFSNVLHVDEYTGKIPNVEPFAWVPIARFVVACHCDEPVPSAFYLSCNLEQTVIQGFDNDLGEEMFRVSNSVSPLYYHRNVKGYTIFVFGWNEANPKTVNWRLEMVKMKYFHGLHLCNLLMNPTCSPYPMPALDVFEIRNFYVPNRKLRILRCLIKVQKQTLLTLRLSLSYSDVQFTVVIFLDKRFCEPSESTPFGKIIAKVTSFNGAVIIPSLFLEYVEPLWWGESTPVEVSTVYIVEAFVINNSWPLTKQEWGLIEPLRVNGETWKDNTTSVPSKRASESRRKFNRTSRRSTSEQKVENPFWLLQALNDAAGSDSDEPMILEEDKSYAESVKAMKMCWEEKDPGRNKRGKELRMNFLYSLYLEQWKNAMCYAEDHFGETAAWNDHLEDPQAVLDHLSSLSYLINDTSPTRYTYSPRILPVTPLLDLLCKYKETTALVSAAMQDYSKPSYSFDDITEFSLKIVNDFLEEMEDERKDFLRQCLHYRCIMKAHTNEEQQLSNRLMEQAYEGRLKAVERMMT